MSERTGKDAWSVLELLRWTTSHFESLGIETARLDAECLLAAALSVDRLRLYIDFEKPVAPVVTIAVPALGSRNFFTDAVIPSGPSDSASTATI